MKERFSDFSDHFDFSDEEYMRLALELAKKGAGWVNPNPMVGCVIVSGGNAGKNTGKDAGECAGKDIGECNGNAGNAGNVDHAGNAGNAGDAGDDTGRNIIGKGYHARFGERHAERAALADCYENGYDPAGSTAYVTLEPCSHHGKTPPCCDALIEAGIARVVVGSSDPNPLVAGRGIERLQSSGIEVTQGVLKNECDKINEPFFHFITTKKPYVIAKFASTLDGKIATYTGASKWITGEKARARVHEDRARFSAIMVGVGTVISDNPQLSARCDSNSDSSFDNHDLRQMDQLDLHCSESCHLGLHQPIRVIVDTNLRTPIDANVVVSAHEQPTLIATSVSDEEMMLPYKDMGCSIVQVQRGDDGHVNLNSLFEILGAMNLDSVYVEGGPTLLGALFDRKIPNRVDAYVAPKIFGGTKAPSAIGGLGVPSPDSALCLKGFTVEKLGDDLLVSGRI